MNATVLTKPDSKGRLKVRMESGEEIEIKTSNTRAIRFNIKLCDVYALACTIYELCTLMKANTSRKEFPITNFGYSLALETLTDLMFTHIDKERGITRPSIKVLQDHNSVRWLMNKYGIKK